MQLSEIHIVAGLQEEIPNLEMMERIINMYGSFLTIRDNYVYFVHQSDYLTVNVSDVIFPAGPGRIYYDMFSRSLMLFREPCDEIYTTSKILGA